jgi:release factor glutamine methyltransferase
MTLFQLRAEFRNKLNSIYGQSEADSLFYFCSDHLLGKSRLDVSVNAQELVPQEQQQKFKKILSRLQQHEPVQYLIGETHFFGLNLKVNSEVLIPRPETEELVQLILNTVSGQNSTNYKIIDMGTGSGCIAMALKDNLKCSDVYAVDISDKALKLAAHNAQLNGLDIHFRNHDILQKKPLFKESHEIQTTPLKFDIIVSNPPYVREKEKLEMQNNVLDYEPSLALFVPDEDPLIFYRALADFALQHLNKSGFLFFEINQYLGAKLKALLRNKGFKSIELTKDTNGNDRMIKAKFE